MKRLSAIALCLASFAAFGLTLSEYSTQDRRWTTIVISPPGAGQWQWRTVYITQIQINQDDIVDVHALLQLTNDQSYNVGCSFELGLADDSNSNGWSRIGPRLGSNIDPDVIHHDSRALFARYQADANMGLKYAAVRGACYTDSTVRINGQAIAVDGGALYVEVKRGDQT